MNNKVILHARDWGMQVVLSEYLTELGPPVEVPRTWRARLFSLPWCPWQATRTERHQVPMKGGLIMGGKIYMHPAAYEAFKRATPNV